MKDLKDLLGLKKQDHPKTEEEIRQERMVWESNKQVNRNRKILLLVVAIAALIAAWYIKGNWVVPGDQVKTCVLTINCTQAYDNRELLPEEISKQIKKKGRITTNSIFVVDEGETVQGLLESYGEKNNVEIIFDGKNINKIKYLSNGDAGAGSHWAYSVNGDEKTSPAGDCVINHDDEIVIYYVIE